MSNDTFSLDEEETDPIALVEERSKKRFKCNSLIKKVTTCVDGGYDVTLSLSEDDIDVATELMRVKKNDGMVHVTFKLIDK